MFQGIDWVTLRSTAVTVPQAFCCDLPLAESGRQHKKAMRPPAPGQPGSSDPQCPAAGSSDEGASLMQAAPTAERAAPAVAPRSPSMPSSPKRRRLSVEGAKAAKGSEQSPTAQSDGLLLHFHSSHSRSQWEEKAAQAAGPCCISCCRDCARALENGNMPQYALANDLWAGPVPSELQDLTEASVTGQKQHHNRNSLRLKSNIFICCSISAL